MVNDREKFRYFLKSGVYLISGLILGVFYGLVCFAVMPFLCAYESVKNQRYNPIE